MFQNGNCHYSRKKIVQLECFSICALKFAITISFIDKVAWFSDTKIPVYIFFFTFLYTKQTFVTGTRKPKFLLDQFSFLYYTGKLRGCLGTETEAAGCRCSGGMAWLLLITHTCGLRGEDMEPHPFTIYTSHVCCGRAKNNFMCQVESHFLFPSTEFPRLAALSLNIEAKCYQNCYTLIPALNCR